MGKIILTGGGTAGHVTPNLALLPSLKGAGYGIRYTGSYQGMERKLTGNADIHYDGIPSSKLRRYFDTKNFFDLSRAVKDYAETGRFLKCHRPDVTFSKNGFAAAPAVFAARHYRISVITHESDMTPGLANKICIPSALKVCYNLPETPEYLPSSKAVLTSSPVREELLQGDRLPGLIYARLTASKPILPVTGGSLGSVAVNVTIRSILPRLLSSYQVIHICSKGNLDESLIGTAGYVQYEYVDALLKHLLAATDLVISRAGANSICELLTLREPSLLIPLSVAASRGDQILNVDSFIKQGFSKVLEEEVLSDNSLLDAINNSYLSRNSYIQSTGQSNLNNVVKTVISLIESRTR